MKLGNLKKKAGSLMLAAAMIVTSFPVPSPEAHAAEAPDRATFATAEQLKAFDTDDTDGSSNAAKVYFGKNDQEWWIAGSQSDDSLTLFAASPLVETGPAFEADYSNNKPYRADWGCHYPGEAPSEVYPNHYGASPLRTILKEWETSCFLPAEQRLMNDTTIYNYDTKNSRVYSTTDKLYLPYGEDQAVSITVGANASDALDRGMNIDKAYWAKDSREGFWLRNPALDSGGVSHQTNVEELVGMEVCVMRSTVCSDVTVMLVPAFELNLSPVLFASAVKAASSKDAGSGTIADGTAMSLRLDGAGKAIGTLEYDGVAGRIVARKDENAEGAVSLVVQGKDGDRDWYYSVPAGETTVVTKKQIQDTCSISTEIEFAKCKIWLETTIDDVIYAKMGVNQITITAGEQCVMWGNGIDQSAYTVSEDGLSTGDSISEITLTPSGEELMDNGTITISAVKIVNEEGEDVTGNYDITLAEGTLQVIHNTTLVPDRIEASKTKTAYMAGESLQVDDLTVTAYYADGYSRAVTGFTTNASDIDMSAAGDKTLTVSYTENGGTKTADVTIKVSAPPHTHVFGTEWKSDGDSHWHECDCGEKKDAAAHTEDGGSVTKAPTETEAGVRTYRCSVCGYVMRTEEIEKLPPTSTEMPEQTGKPGQTEQPSPTGKPGQPGQTEQPSPTGKPGQAEQPSPTGQPGQTERPASIEQQEPVTSEEMKENSAKLDSGISVNWKENALFLKWTKIAGAEGYDVFAAQSGKKSHKMSLVKVVKNGKASASLAKIAGKKISRKEVYSVRIKAWKYVDGKKVYTGSSRTYHIAGKENSKYTNAKKLKPAKKKYTLKKGKNVRIQVTIAKEAKKKKLLPKSYGSTLQYWSGNTKIATVTREGRVKAKKKGICYIYVTALNGVRAKIRITVK